MARRKETFIDLLQQYFGAHLPVSRGLSAATIRSYKAAFRLLLEFMWKERRIRAEQVDLEMLEGKLIQDFLNWLETERGASIQTRNQRLSAIASFSRYAQDHDFEAGAVFRNSVLKVPKKKARMASRSFFTREEVKILLEVPDPSTEIGLRDRTLLCFMYASGARAQEACSLAVGDIQFHPDRAGINIHGKGGKVRRIGIPLNASAILKGYIAHRGLEGSGSAHVFSSQTHEMMTVSCVEEIFAKTVAKARKGNPGLFKGRYSPHSMRHTTATHMLEAGVPLVVLKNFLGHVSLHTTQVYAQVTQDAMNRQLREWNRKWFMKDGQPDNEGKTQPGIPPFLI